MIIGSVFAPTRLRHCNVNLIPPMPWQHHGGGTVTSLSDAMGWRSHCGTPCDGTNQESKNLSMSLNIS